MLNHFYNYYCWFILVSLASKKDKIIFFNSLALNFTRKEFHLFSKIFFKMLKGLT